MDIVKWSAVGALVGCVLALAAILGEASAKALIRRCRRGHDK